MANAGGHSAVACSTKPYNTNDDKLQGVGDQFNSQQWNTGPLEIYTFTGQHNNKSCGKSPPGEGFRTVSNTRRFPYLSLTEPLL